MKSVLWFVGGFIVTVISGAGMNVPTLEPAGAPGIMSHPVEVAAIQDPGKVRPPDVRIQQEIGEAMRLAELAIQEIDLEQLQIQAQLMLDELDIGMLQEEWLDDLDFAFDELQLQELDFPLPAWPDFPDFQGEIFHDLPFPPMPPMPDFHYPDFYEFEMAELWDYEFEMPEIEFEFPEIDFPSMAPFAGRRGRSGMLVLLEMTYQQQGDPGLALYNEAKTLLFDEKYQEARQKFMDLAVRFAQSVYVDDSLFWAAWAQEHMRGQTEQAFQAYQEFLNRYAESPFVTHARTSMVKLAGELYRQGMEQYKQYIEDARDNSEEDIRLYALNALARQEGADIVSIVQGVLADGSASSRLKRESVDLLRRDDSPLAVQALETAAREHADPEVRVRAISALGHREESGGFEALMRLYGNEQSVNARRYIVEATGRFRETDWAADAVEFLSRVARDDDNEDVRDRALSVLTNFDSTLSMPHLTGLLDSMSDVDTRRTVLSVISRSDDPRRIPILVEEIRSGSDERTRRAAVSYLGRIEGPEALDALIGIANSNVTEAVRVTAVDEIGDYEGSKAAEALVAIARGSAPTAVRREALDELGNRRTSDSFAVLRDIALGQDEMAMRGRALSELRGWGAESAPVFEQIALNDPEQDMRREAVSALGRLEEGAGWDSLVKIFQNSEDTRIRSAVVDFMWRINDANSLDTIIQAAKTDADPDVRRRAVQILGRSEDPKAKQALRDILNIPPMEVR